MCGIIFYETELCVQRKRNKANYIFIIVFLRLRKALWILGCTYVMCNVNCFSVKFLYGYIHIDINGETECN